MKNVPMRPNYFNYYFDKVQIKNIHDIERGPPKILKANRSILLENFGN